MSDTRITESGTLAQPQPLFSSSEAPSIDAAIPLVRDDEPWVWYAVFLDADGETPADLTGKAVTAAIRWVGGDQVVTVEVLDEAGGHVKLSLTAAETVLMPYGQLPRLFIAVDSDTEAVIPVNVLEGMFSVAEAPAP